MTAREFYDCVVKMRIAQKQYFRTRSSSALVESRRLESIVDDEIGRVRGILEGAPKQGDLFEE